MSLLIIGATGTLGRQITLQALKKGYRVSCLVRNFNSATFLKKWNVQLVYGDLSVPETISSCLEGISVIIDASTSRPENFDSIKKVDWEGKLALIEAAKVAKIKRFIFCSTYNIEQFVSIPLIRMKYGIEKKLQQADIPYTIFRLNGFYQGLVKQYALPILDKMPVWTTNETVKIPYMDTQDIAKFFVKSLQLPETKNRIFILGGPKNWLSDEVIKLCEQLVGQSATINQVPAFFLKFVSKILNFFAWSQNISDRLAFVDILIFGNNSLQISTNLYEIFKIELTTIIQLNDYLLEYFVRLLKKLQDISFEDIQKQRNLII